MPIEDDSKNFLILIVQTISSIILWLLINIFLGLYMQYGLFEVSPSIINVGYYLFFIAGCYALFRFFKKRWVALDMD